MSGELFIGRHALSLPPSDYTGLPIKSGVSFFNKTFQIEGNLSIAIFKAF